MCDSRPAGATRTRVSSIDIVNRAITMYELIEPGPLTCSDKCRSVLCGGLRPNVNNCGDSSGGQLITRPRVEKWGYTYSLRTGERSWLTVR